MGDCIYFKESHESQTEFNFVFIGSLDEAAKMEIRFT
jgi:hypothetical protein